MGGSGAGVAYERFRLAADQLRLAPGLTGEPATLSGITGQDRAREAIAFGLHMRAAGYNIVVSGVPASGRNELVRELVKPVAEAQAAPRDWVYLNNFGDPRRPRITSLPAGTADVLSRAMDGLLDVCRHALPAAFADDSYDQRLEQALAQTNLSRKNAVEELQRRAQALGFGINATPLGLMPVPLDQEGHPLSSEAFVELPESERTPIEQRGEKVQEQIAATVRILRRLETEARERIEQVDAEITRTVIGPSLDELVQRFGSLGLEDFVKAIETDIVSNVGAFKRVAAAGPGSLPPELAQELETMLQRYRVNCFVTHPEAQKGAPVVEERSPTYQNLFGRIEFENRFGALVTDFTRIRAGAIHRANGGFLILQLAELLADPRSWARLKHALKTGEAPMDEPGEHLGIAIVGLVPMPAPLELKVILVGSPMLVALLDAYDPDFDELFKVRADFEPDLPADQGNVATYAAFVRAHAERCGLRRFDGPAIEEVVRYGSRLADRQDRLSTRLGLVADLCTEADQFAADAGAEAVGAEHVAAAEAARDRRSGLVPDRLRRMISEGALHVETTGTVVGQVNGLAVFAAGDHEFGIPMRITCRTGAGQQGVVDIERETERSGSIHTKGVLVLNGYLMGTFGREQPLAFNASLTFEQSYDEVEGDSASSAELYAILTSLADVPVRQEVAVTGSVDQFGNIQAVGGVTAKIEGFFDVCREVGLTGNQGVILPATNVRNLALRADLVEAVEQGRFHLWAVERVEDGLEILTGIPAQPRPGVELGEALFERVVAALDQMREVAAAAAPRSPDGQRLNTGIKN